MPDSRIKYFAKDLKIWLITLTIAPQCSLNRKIKARETDLNIEPTSEITIRNEIIK